MAPDPARTCAKQIPTHKTRLSWPNESASWRLKTSFLKSGRLLRQGALEDDIFKVIEYVDEEGAAKPRYTVTMMPRFLEVSWAGYYAWKHRRIRPYAGSSPAANATGSTGLSPRFLPRTMALPEHAQSTQSYANKALISACMVCVKPWNSWDLLRNTGEHSSARLLRILTLKYVVSWLNGSLIRQFPPLGYAGILPIFAPARAGCI